MSPISYLGVTYRQKVLHSLIRMDLLEMHCIDTVVAFEVQVFKNGTEFRLAAGCDVEMRIMARF